MLLDTASKNACFQELPNRIMDRLEILYFTLSVFSEKFSLFFLS